MRVKIKAAFIIIFIIGIYKLNAQVVLTNGVIDAHHWRADESSIPLRGTCLFFEGQLLSPDDCEDQLGSVSDFPKLFVKEGGRGFGTYQIKVFLPINQKNFALALPQMYCSYKLWANGKVVAENGIVGKSEAESKPQWLPQTVPFQIHSDTLTLVLQISNFHHAKGGIKEPMFLGLPSMMEFKRNLSEVSNLIEFIALFLLGIFFLSVFIFKHTKKVAFYFALLCITWATRSIFSNLYLFIHFFPGFDWYAMIRIEYITLYLTMIWAILFLGSIFHNEANPFIKYGLVFCNIIFTAFTIFSPPWLFTQGLNIYLIASGVLLIYGAFTVIRAWVNERTGSGMLTLSLILGLNIFGYDIFVFEGFSTYNPIIFSAGYVTIFLLMSLAVAMHLQIIKSKPSPTTRLTYDDLYKNQ